ncbi:DUF4442 domain-containing protein [Pseudomonas sp. RP23018S]|uniref:DUF4442 domain-containing protein n=1 Tax=Pseudomonas sp. RP23018S TaxID=3096037 RepID=UPI002ACA6069|nr:DUF4442 domain-containing protein [Pseudomonas sp. RP23018S]MDZ5602997.1 DUF4442 domain-containing protein [Pseudomonas sp. RP23018S]
MSDPRKRARRARMLRWLLNFYPPYLGAGVRVLSISPDLRRIKVRMKLTLWNRNYVGTQFGGSLYSMVDPFYMLLLIEQLGSEYIVWDKAASIDFIAPGKGTVYADFEVDDALLDDIRQQTAGGKKCLPRLQVDIRDEAGELVARVDKTLYVRLKPQTRQA